MNGTTAIIWKEWQELFGRPGLRGKTGLLLNLLVFGVVLPYQMGETWMRSPASALVWVWVPMWLVIMVIADAFAGERERHTLETLLATRLSDGAILAGKIGAAMSYAFAVTGAAIVLGLLTLNVTTARGALIGISAPALLGVVVVGGLMALAVASLGVVVSLRSPTVRQAEQTLGGVVIAGLVVPFLLLKQVPPAWKSWLLAPEHAALFGYLLVGLLGMVALGLTALASHAFRRAQLNQI